MIAARPNTPLVNLPPARNVTFFAPRRVAQVSFQEWADDGKLRQPVFLGLRNDKVPEDVLLPEV
ncbi:hypothetical protein [Edaphobacter sp.]|uniref:ATP dependent DNA ligase n=1 Tax=Edaphobacter sp. TaxID=1934404 RepID=UPI002DB8FEDE|nr:hypothetical protein [Edaphobacter sp.]